jgi:hypothetical protein
MSADLALKLASAGAAGVAALALLIWNLAHTRLVAAAKDSNAKNKSLLEDLAKQLSGYQKLVFGALIAAVVVQLGLPFVQQPAPAPDRDLVLSINPDDETVSKYMPVVRKDGQPVEPGSGKKAIFNFAVTRQIDVDVMKMRDYIRDRENVIAEVAVTAANKTGQLGR